MHAKEFVTITCKNKHYKTFWKRRIIVAFGASPHLWASTPKPIKHWLRDCNDLQNDQQPAELMFSMTFLSSAERLTIVVTKARNLKLNEDAKSVPSQWFVLQYSLISFLKFNVQRKTQHNWKSGIRSWVLTWVSPRALGLDGSFDLLSITACHTCSSYP